MGTKEKLTVDQVRAQFPVCVAFADKVRDAFGDDNRMIYAKENGKEIGRLSGSSSDKVVKLSQLVIDSRLPDSIERNGQGRLVAKHEK